MGSNMIFSLVSLFYIFMTCCIYFGKKRVHNLETRIYSILLVTNLLGLGIEIISTFINLNVLGFEIVKVFSLKLIMVYFFTWLFVFSIYIYCISRKDINSFNSKNIFIIYVILLFITLILPIYENRSGNMINYTYGPCVNFVYFISGILILFCIITMIINIKTINIRKIIPLFMFMFLGLVVGGVQVINPNLLLMASAEAFITTLMYHTIENPDVKMMNELEFAKNNAERANMAKTDFLSSMSHEIRTPLNAIVGFSNSILEDKTLDEARDEARDIIMASYNLLEIVNGILDISKIEAGKMEVVRQDYNFISMINDVVKLVKPRLGDKPISLNVDISKDTPCIMNGDVGKVKEIVTNLLTNAVKYTEKGNIDLVVSCVNEKNVSKLVISVEDTGRGIKPEKIDKLFTKFDRLEEDKNTTLEGTGLGLAITKSLVEMMGGKIVVQSKYGSGSKFTVFISQKIVSMVDNIVKDKKEIGELKDYSKKKILVVDDNNLNIKVAVRLLKNYNIVADTCMSGFECLEKVKSNNYDLILMDDMMPKLSGVETFKRLKKDEKFKCPVVILTANAISGMKEKYLKEGLDDYLAKPIDKYELDRVLDKFLEQNN